MKANSIAAKHGLALARVGTQRNSVLDLLDRPKLPATYEHSGVTFKLVRNALVYSQGVIEARIELRAWTASNPVLEFGLSTSQDSQDINIKYFSSEASNELGPRSADKRLDDAVRDANLVGSLSDDQQEQVSMMLQASYFHAYQPTHTEFIAKVKALKGGHSEIRVRHGLARHIAEHFYVPQSNAKAFEDAMQQLAKDTNQRYSALLKRFNATPR